LEYKSFIYVFQDCVAEWGDTVAGKRRRDWGRRRGARASLKNTCRARVKKAAPWASPAQGMASWALRCAKYKLDGCFSFAYFGFVRFGFA
jgi:hypothetical protein